MELNKFRIGLIITLIIGFIVLLIGSIIKSASTIGIGFLITAIPGNILYFIISDYNQKKVLKFEEERRQEDKKKRKEKQRQKALVRKKKEEKKEIEREKKEKQAKKRLYDWLNNEIKLKNDVIDISHWSPVIISNASSYLMKNGYRLKGKCEQTKDGQYFNFMEEKWHIADICLKQRLIKKKKYKP